MASGITAWGPKRIFLVFLAVGSLVLASPTPDRHEGMVDLGYAKHVPTFVNTTLSGRRIFVYKNIRFAKPPVGHLRFRRPDTRLPKIPGIQNGSVPWGSNSCISTAPEGVPYPDLIGTRGQEDCLFLDVYVPEGVKPGHDVPVMHWFHGSAFAFGNKEIFTFPMGLLDAAGDLGNFILVANNYRMGILGWVSVPGLDMDANVGMHDCLSAAEWTSRYIDRFGGDPLRVTAVGQSAGAAVIGLLTTLKGGHGKLPFQQGIISSPDIPPRRNTTYRQQDLFQKVLDAANCTSLNCLRSASEDTMAKANSMILNSQSDAGGGVLGPSPGIGPVTDGAFVPDMPEVLYRQGRYHKELRSLLVGNMADEGRGLMGELPAEFFPGYVKQLMPGINDTTIAKIRAQYDYADEPARLAWDWTTDVMFAMNANNIANAFSDRTRRYIMSTPPATHGLDLSYFFYTDQQTTPVSDVGLALRLRHFILQFIHGQISESDWPLYGPRKTMVNVTQDDIVTQQLPGRLADRWDLINSILLDPSNGV